MLSRPVGAPGDKGDYVANGIQLTFLGLITLELRLKGVPLKEVFCGGTSKKKYYTRDAVLVNPPVHDGFWDA